MRGRAAVLDGHGAGSEGVDADLGGRQQDTRRAVREALGMGGVRGVERGLADDAHLLDAAEEDVGRGEQGEVGVVVLVVVPAEEGREPAACVKLAGEATRVVRLVLQGLELRLAEGVVVGDVRAAEAPLDAKRRQ